MDEPVTEARRWRVPLPHHLLILLFNRVIREPYRAAQAEQRAFMETEASRRVDGRTLILFVTVALSLTVLDYYGMSDRADELASALRFFRLDGLAEKLTAAMVHPVNIRINRLAYWAAGCFFSYFIVPSLVIKLIFRENLGDYGLRLAGALKDWWIYVVLFGAVAVAVVIVSKTPHFQEQYPFYDLYEDEPLWPTFWIWEALYFSQFFALEFFFRGFMVHGLRRRFGYYAVFAMMVPYCMIHYGKPFAETVGAIVAGIVLGSLSLKTRSIWLGIAIHASVALSMDFASLWRKGYFGL